MSLLHSRRPGQSSRSPSSTDSEKAQRPQVSRGSTGTDLPSSLQALGGKNSSGETSNAENWFEKSNQEVRDSSTAFVDNDPPFFMRNSSSESSPDAQNSHLRHLSTGNDHTNSLPLRTELLQLATDGSGVDDFRSVIDDLTVENMKLKRRLMKYEKLHDSHLKNEKLFEVRIYSLPPERKRELEETLRKFAASLGTTAENASPPDGYSRLVPMLKTGRTFSSQTSLQHADSAYASMSASRQGSSTLSGVDGKRKVTPTQYLAARRQNIHSYLHNVPEDLLPQQNPATMTERAKKKLVVRRMEQLFAGKGAVSDGPQQSQQQQEVSQTAARVDRSALEAQGQRAGQEGTREAHIMKHDAEEHMSLAENEVDEAATRKQPQERTPPQQALYSHSPKPSSLDQRPTRPLDLDPHRAQVPAENIRYMRQMGFSPLDPGKGLPEEDHGWIYLNFLINMAQLHTVNVTSDFVLQALGEHSNKFIISSDGRKVRWKGGASLTRNSSNGGGASSERVSDELLEGQSPRKRTKLSHTDSVQLNLGGRVLTSPAVQRLRTESNKHVYIPLFFHKEEEDEADDSSSVEEEDSMESPSFPTPVARDSSWMTSSGIRNNYCIPASIRKKQERDDGPMIFYSNARFCTDLSGDRKPKASNDGPMYTPASSVPVGKPASTAGHTSEKRGLLADASELPEPMDLSDNPIPASMEVSFPPDSPSESTSSNGQEPIELEVTGIGGVWPADNFAISVDSRHTHVSQQRIQKPTRRVETKALPPRVRQILENSGVTPKTHPIVDQQFVASAVRGLPPSELPPALSFMPSDDESIEDDSDAEDDSSEAPPSPAGLPPAAAPQPVGFQYSLSDQEDDEEDDSDEDDESDDEVDFLAAAREADPEAVRQKEREYDANMAERLAEEIPAGSSAATAGGGSRFASPADGVDKDELRRARQVMRAKAASMRRAGTNDRMVASGRQDSSSDDSEDDEDDAISDMNS